MSLRRSVLLCLAFSFFALISPVSTPRAERAGSLLSVRAHDRVLSAVDDAERVILRGDVHPLAKEKYEVGSVSRDYWMDHMVLQLKSDPAQQQALDDLLAAQYNPMSHYYQQWITPDTYGERFGVSSHDLVQITNWLQSHDLQVDDIMPSRLAIVFSGDVQQVESTFHSPIHAYRVSGELHHANSRDPEIPQAFSSVVGGVLSLHDFRSQPMHSALRKIAPEFTSGSSHYTSPADFSVIYNIDPLYERGITGAGQNIAIAGRSNINLADVRQFRSTFGLPTNVPQLILNGANPGTLNAAEESEALLDVEWSGAIARNAQIKFVISRSTSASDGVFLSSQYIVNHNLAPVMSVSFGLCEAALGNSGNNFFNSLWKQAAAQGITVFVSSGDSGAAGCDSPSSARASKGRAVNGLCSSPYAVCVGGTQFNDGSNTSLYWSSANMPGSLASALSYIPETAWNESSTWGLWATGGGASSLYGKPSWQRGVGVPNDARRDTPDVSFTAAAHDGYLITMHGGLSILAGTSVSSPAWAGLMALAVQSTAARQGNANPALYGFAMRQRSGGANVFHDIASGSNTVPGVTGHAAGIGYDLATGLGSVDANALVTHWSDPVPRPAFLLSAPSTLMAAPGRIVTATLVTTVSNGFNAGVSLSAAGLLPGMTASFTPALIRPPGGGQSTLVLSLSASVAPGKYSIVVSATGGGMTQRVNLKVNVPVLR